MAHDLDARCDEHHAEHEEQPPELLDERGAGEDEHGAHRQRAEDAPEQHPVLVARRDRERREDHRPHEDVVDAERLLDHVAAEVLAERLATPHEQHHEREPEPARHPDRRLDQRVLGRRFLVAAVQEQVDRQQDRDHAEQRRPVPRADVDAEIHWESSLRKQRLEGEVRRSLPPRGRGTVRRAAAETDRDDDEPLSGYSPSSVSLREPGASETPPELRRLIGPMGPMTRRLEDDCGRARTRVPVPPRRAGVERRRRAPSHRPRPVLRPGDRSVARLRAKLGVQGAPPALALGLHRGAVGGASALLPAHPIRPGVGGPRPRRCAGLRALPAARRRVRSMDFTASTHRHRTRRRRAGT